MKDIKWIIIFQQIVGGDGRPFETAYHWDGEYFKDWGWAKSHGFDTRGSDDFNIGKVVDGKLVGFYWMKKLLNDYPLREISEEIGLSV